MSRLRAFLAGTILSAASALAGPPTLPELFGEAKAQVKSGSWAEGLKTLDALEAEANRPGHEEERRQLVAPLAFYRGVCNANLGNAERARQDFAIFLKTSPGATIDGASYSKKAVAAFEAASGEAASGGPLSLLQRFEKFEAPPGSGDGPDERWADGPVKWIMTAGERTAWGKTDAGARAGFVEEFWKGRHIARAEFDRRVAFADAHFGQDEQRRGSLTDAGMVFILLGAPSWTGRKPVLTGEDPSDSGGMSLAEHWTMVGRNSVHVDGARVTDASGAFREIWHYRREALPGAVSAYQVNVVFVTKKGYGRSVLQREPATLAALDAARAGRSAP